MTIASHYVFKDMLNALEKPKEAKSVFEKFHKRYRDDIELVDVCKRFRGYLKSKDSAELKVIKKTLLGLEETRRNETGGGNELWYKDRRPGRGM